MPPAQVLSPGSRRRKEQCYRSVISDVFDGSILSLVQCLTCDRVSARPGSSEALGVGVGASVSSPMPLPFPRGEALSGSWGASPLASHLPAGGRGSGCPLCPV